jgi:hypothetical protein
LRARRAGHTTQTSSSFFRARKAGQGVGGSRSTTVRAPGGGGTRRQVDDEQGLRASIAALLSNWEQELVLL